MPVRTWAWVALVLLFALLQAGAPAEALAKTNPKAEAEAILEATGVRGGLVVHLGSGDGLAASIDRLALAWPAPPAVLGPEPGVPLADIALRFVLPLTKGPLRGDGHFRDFVQDRRM